MTSEDSADQCVQRRLACSVGDSPTGARVRSPVAWVAFVEETKRMKPTDKAALEAVSEPPGRSGSEPTSGLDKKRIRRLNPLVRDEGSMAYHGLTEAACPLRRGGRGSTVARTCRATAETVLVPLRNRWSKVDRITGTTGKAIEGETVAARSVVPTSTAVPASRRRSGWSVIESSAIS
jgi:hypothetical protein